MGFIWLVGLRFSGYWDASFFFLLVGVGGLGVAGVILFGACWTVWFGVTLLIHFGSNRLGWVG